MFKHTLGYILERALLSRKVGYEKRFYPRRHLLSKEECAHLKSLIRARLRHEDYRCHQPDARCYLRYTVTRFGAVLTKPVYRLRLQRRWLKVIPKTQLTGLRYFWKTQEVWM